MEEQHNVNMPYELDENLALSVKVDIVKEAQWYDKKGMKHEKNKEWEKALACYEKAAELGSIRSYTNQGTFYLKGTGVEVDKPKAYACFLKAAERGHARAQYQLGRLCEKGEGINQDVEQALFWYEKGAQQDNAEAKARYQRLVKKHYSTSGEASERVLRQEEKETLIRANAHWQNSLQVIKYEKLIFGKEIGGGIFGRVYEGQWQREKVAIKKLFENKFKRNLEHEFISEVSILYRLNSPRIVRLYGVTLSPMYCIVLEYVPLGSLEDCLLKNKIIGWPAKIQIGADVGEGLGYLHAHHIVHRDLKSANILVDQDKRAKLSDFGLAKLKSGENTTQINVNPHVIGSSYWLPPEILLAGGRVPFTPKTDIYSYGMVLWEIASGRKPLKNVPLVEATLLLQKAQREEIPIETPEEVRRMILRCWNEVPEERPPAQEVVKILDTYQAVLADPMGSAEMLFSSERREGEEEGLNHSDSGLYVSSEEINRVSPNLLPVSSFSPTDERKEEKKEALEGCYVSWSGGTSQNNITPQSPTLLRLSSSSTMSKPSLSFSSHTVEKISFFKPAQNEDNEERTEKKETNELKQKIDEKMEQENKERCFSSQPHAKNNAPGQSEEKKEGGLSLEKK